MARTTLPKTTAPSPNPLDGVTVTMTAADVPNKNQFVLTGREVVIAHNTHATTTYNVTVTSFADPFGRLTHITNDAIVAGAIHVYGPFGLDGWRQTDAMLYLEADNAAVKFGIILIP